jgi:hypothetical protein
MFAIKQTQKKVKNMTSLKQQKINNDYKTVTNSISSSHDYKGLQTLANNIRMRISKDADYKHFVRLANKAEHKSRVLRILEKCPSPINKSNLEEKAFENFVQGTAVLNKMPSVRVIHQQLKKLGYAKTMARQVENSVGNAVFFNMAKKGIVKNTSEYFIYKYGQHLVKATTYNKIEDLFGSSEQLLEVA